MAEEEIIKTINFGHVNSYKPLKYPGKNLSRQQEFKHKNEGGVQRCKYKIGSQQHVGH